MFLAILLIAGSHRARISSVLTCNLRSRLTNSSQPCQKWANSSIKWDILNLLRYYSNQRLGVAGCMQGPRAYGEMGFVNRSRGVNGIERMRCSMRIAEASERREITSSGRFGFQKRRRHPASAPSRRTRSTASRPPTPRRSRAWSGTTRNRPKMLGVNSNLASASVPAVLAQVVEMLIGMRGITPAPRHGRVNVGFFAHAALDASPCGVATLRIACNRTSDAKGVSDRRLQAISIDDLHQIDGCKRFRGLQYWVKREQAATMPLPART